MAVGAQPVDGDKCGNRQHVIKLIDRLVVLTHLGVDESYVRRPVGLLIGIPRQRQEVNGQSPFSNRIFSEP